MESWNFSIGKTAKADVPAALAALHIDHDAVNMENDRAETGDPNHVCGDCKHLRGNHRCPEGLTCPRVDGACHIGTDGAYCTCTAFVFTGTRHQHRDHPGFAKDLELAKKAIIAVVDAVDDPFVIISASGHVPEGSAGVDGISVSVSGHK